MLFQRTHIYVAKGINKKILYFLNQINVYCWRRVIILLKDGMGWDWRDNPNVDSTFDLVFLS